LGLRSTHGTALRMAQEDVDAKYGANVLEGTTFALDQDVERPLEHTSKERRHVSEPPWMTSLRQQVTNLREHHVAEENGSLTFRGLHRASGREVEVRVLGAKTYEERRAIRNEVEVLEQCGGGDILTLFGAASAVDSTRISFPIAPKGVSDANVAFLFYEPFSYDLNEVLSATYSGRIGRKTELRLTVEILRGLRKLEKAGFMHRDVRPENIMIVGDCFSAPGCHAKIGGFCNSCTASALRRGDEPEFVGDPMYIAPEVWKGKTRHRKADVWAAGLVAYDLFVGGLPNELMTAAIGGSHENLREHPLREYVPRQFDISNDARFQEFMLEDWEVATLIQSMLTRTAFFRPSVKKALARASKLAESRSIDVPEQK